MLLRNILGLIIFIFLPVAVQASVDCSGSRCQYTGGITQLYLSSGGSILAKLDRRYPELISGAQDIGVSGVTQSSAVGVQMFIDGTETEKLKALEFAKYIFNTLLVAKTSGRKVTMQLRSQSNGYMMLDRVWLK
jgi:hypothetical protein